MIFTQTISISFFLPNSIALSLSFCTLICCGVGAVGIFVFAGIFLLRLRGAGGVCGDCVNIAFNDAKYEP